MKEIKILNYIVSHTEWEDSFGDKGERTTVECQCTSVDRACELLRVKFRNIKEGWEDLHDPCHGHAYDPEWLPLEAGSDPTWHLKLRYKHYVLCGGTAKLYETCTLSIAQMSNRWINPQWI